MDKCKSVDTPIEVGTKLSKDDVGTAINSTLYKKFSSSIMYLTATRPDIEFLVVSLESWKKGVKIHCRYNYSWLMVCNFYKH